MRLKKRPLLNSRLYLILDKYSCPKDNIAGVICQAAKTGGIDLVQLRENKACGREFLKDAQIIRRICREKGITFIVNNRVDIARITDADGLHLGQSDLPIAAARGIFGKNKIIGVSCHNLAQALKAQSDGADYISLGPIFLTRTKPDLKAIGIKLIKVFKQRISIPFFVIGGIKKSNIKKVLSCGANRFALCSGICRASDIKKAVKELRSLINEYTVNK
ncbi:MAG: thiamine phosphate synthase [Candidatus Omnitrophota bacterium]